MKMKVWFMICLMVLSMVPAALAKNDDASVGATADAVTDAESEITEDTVDDLVVRKKIRTVAECTRTEVLYIQELIKQG